MYYSSPFLSTGNTFYDPQWTPEAMNSTKLYVYCLFLYIRSDDKDKVTITNNIEQL